MGVDVTVYKIRFVAIPPDDDWSDHEALHARIGNAATVAYLVSSTVCPTGSRSSQLILTRGSTAPLMQAIEIHDVGALRQEAQGLPEDLLENSPKGGYLARFTGQLLALCDAALTHAAPIYF
jgi:hypothetical protein